MLTEFADGRYVAEEQTTIDTNSANSQQAMTLARLASGGLVATWLHNGTIVAQLHDSSGARIGAEFSIAFSSQVSPAIGLASGGFVIGWIGVDANGWGAKAQMFDSA
ncbi:MAG: hypothetical protein H0X53_09245, partial [Sphingomonas sp.]|nr:hypothetical protein [Sphingomonas sp.]